MKMTIEKEKKNATAANQKQFETKNRVQFSYIRSDVQVIQTHSFERMNKIKQIRAFDFISIAKTQRNRSV